MNDEKRSQIERISRYDELIRKQTGKAVRPYHEDGYINMCNRYGTEKDSSEHYRFVQEPTVQDDVLTTTYEGNGLFAKIIDTPSEEALKRGFELKGMSDNKIEDFIYEALDELDWEETAITALKWSRLFGGALAVMLVNDGRGLEEPLNWKDIKSIDDIVVYERFCVTADTVSMFNYDPSDPFKTRSSRLGYPEYFHVSSDTGNFTVHESRTLIFTNGKLPRNATNSLYRFWGMPEYIRLNRAIRDAQISHGTAAKMLDRSIQAVYKMKGLSEELATDEGETRVLKRLQTIDMARGLLNSITIDNEGEDYDFRTFSFTGVSDVVATSASFLSAISSIPQTILFGKGASGLSSTDDTSMEVYYNYVQRIQKTQLRSNLRYLISVILQAGMHTHEVDDIPPIKVEFKSLWSLSEQEQADLEMKKAQIKQINASTAAAYITAQVLDPNEVRRELAKDEEFDIEDIIDENDPDELMPEEGDGDSPVAAPEATKLPQDMLQKPPTSPEMAENGQEIPITNKDEDLGSVGVVVVKDGKIIVGRRMHDTGHGLICGPGGHIESGETPVQAASREMQEEFGIYPNDLMYIGQLYKEPDSGLSPHLFLCTDFEGEPKTDEDEMTDLQWLTMEEIEQLRPSMFQPFIDGVDKLIGILGNIPREDEKQLDFKSVYDIVSLQKFIMQMYNDELLFDPLDDDYDGEVEEWECTNADSYPDHPGNPGHVGGSRAKGAWPSDFPKVMAQTNGKTMKSNPNYQDAKHGDYESAKKLVADVKKDDKIKQIVDSYPDAIVVPVRAKESGHNQIPTAYADAFGEAGMEVSKDILVTQKANRTGKSQVERLMSRNVLEGKVEPGRKYVIVDDVITTGASINEYRKYIEDNGGVVVAASAIAMGRAGSNTIAPKKETIEKAQKKHGEKWLEEYCKKIGFEDGPKSMTNFQVNLLGQAKKETLEKIAK